MGGRLRCKVPIGIGLGTIRRIVGRQEGRVLSHHSQVGSEAAEGTTGALAAHGTGQGVASPEATGAAAI